MRTNLFRHPITALMMSYLAALAVGCEAFTSPDAVARPAPRALADASADGRRLLTADVERAAKELIAATPAEQQGRLLLPFDSQDRYLGPETSQTPSFCAVLAWCPSGWGLPQCWMSQTQLVAMHELLALALSPGGYQTLLSVMNRQRIIGEMEDFGDKTSLAALATANPNAHAPSLAALAEPPPVPWDTWYPVVGGAPPPGKAVDAKVWIWNPPGLDKRKEEFCNYSLAIFGQPGDAKWALRFEGHHITVNLTFLRNEQTGEIAIHGTPMFFGAFPMIIPKSPSAMDDTSAWWWMKGQNLMFSAAHHLRSFWLAVDDDVRARAFIAPTVFPQAAPLVFDTPPPFLISSLATTVDPNAIAKFAHVVVPPNALSAEARWHLEQAYDAYIGAMNPDVAQWYARFLGAMLSFPETGITLSWAGGPLDQFGTHLYSYIAVGPLLLEFLQSNQFTVEHDPTLDANHVHGMFRDMSFDWTDPMAEHHLKDHLVGATK